MRTLLLCLLAIGLTGCASVTATPDQRPKTAAEPTHQETKHFFLWGLTPSSHYVDLNEVCPDQDVRQVQAQTTFANGFLGALTWGVYSPRTIKVWCERQEEA